MSIQSTGGRRQRRRRWESNRSSGQDELDRFVRRLHDGTPGTLLLDYDGTLAPFCEDRQAAIPYPGVRERLESLHAASAKGVVPPPVVISGRPAEEVLRLLGVDPPIEIWGCHGWERISPGGITERIDPAPAVRHALERGFREALELVSHSHVEHKGAAVAVHFRGMEATSRADLRREIETVWERLIEEGHLEIRPFDGGLELRAGGRDKGSAIEQILDGLAPGTRAAYLGDDLTDEDAFEAVQRRGGIGVLVRSRPRPTRAMARLSPPDEVLAFIDRWLDAVRGPVLAPDVRDADVLGKVHPAGGRPARRLVVVSNRLPLVLQPNSDEGWSVERGSGGLVTAMEPVLERNCGLWMGWTGVPGGDIPDIDGLLEREWGDRGYRVRGVELTPQEQEDFYLGFSNQVIWPLFHDFHDRCNFRQRFWDAYTTVNRKFAEGVRDEARDGDFLWIHDYHLMGVAEELRRRQSRASAAFFLHIPFPPLDIFVKLPWRFAILRSLLHYELVGFQSLRDRTNFVHVLRSLVPSAEISAKGPITTVRINGRSVRLGVFPISIDFDEFAEAAEGEEVALRAEELRRGLFNSSPEERDHKVMLLGVDRLDYSKGIPHKLRGFQLALQKYPELRGAVTLVQLIIPSREDIPEYHALKHEIDRLVGEISGEFMKTGWTPVHYQYGRWERAELVANYRAARVALVTPLKDGMNLVAKEFCAASPDDNGVLILSEHAGAAAQLQEGALLVNPYDVEELARAIRRACTMRGDERRARMSRLRERIRAEDIHWWARTFLRAVQSDVPASGEPPASYSPSVPDGFLEGVRPAEPAPVPGGT